jgi:hypothetical protein
MSRNGSGTYTLPAGNPVVTGTTISSSWANNTLNDIATALTGSVASDGQTPMSGPLAMGGNKITGLAAGAGVGEAVNWTQFTTPTFTGNVTVTSVGFVKLPVGTTAERSGSPVDGMIRYNSTLGRYEGYSASAWGGLGGGATGGGSDQIFIENGQTVTTNYTISALKNAGTFGPISIDDGVTVTIPDGSTWSII